MEEDKLYLEEHGIPMLLNLLIATVARSQPDNPISKMVDKLEHLGNWLLCQAAKAKILREKHRSKEAQRLLTETLKLKGVLGHDDPTTCIVMTELGRTLQDLGEMEQAEACYREALEVQERVLGASHRDTNSTANHLGLGLRLQGRFEEAGVLYQRVIKFATSTLGPEHMDTVSAQINFAGCLADQGKWEEALPLFKIALEMREKTLGVDNPRTINSRINVALAWMHLPKEGNKARRAEGRATMAQARKDLLEKCHKPESHPWIKKCNKYILKFDNKET